MNEKSAIRSKGVIAAFAMSVAFGAALPAAAGEGGASGAQVLSGGVGEGERAKLAEEARGYNLKLVFTMSTGNYIAEVPFQVMRGGKTIVDETSKGPWAFVKLAPGSYTVKATYEGKAQTRQVDVPKSGQKRVSFVWPASQRVSEQPAPR
jgi:hypothetical protein